jgi:hypothetical protein
VTAGIWKDGIMALNLKPFGTFRVYPGLTSQTPGPVAFRSATRLDGAEWENDVFGRVKFLFGMGSYLHGAGGAHITIRAALQTSDDVRFFLEYNSRGDMASHAAGQSPVILAGFIDIDPANTKYAWLNHTQVVGRGMLTMDPLAQTYEMYVLV